MTILIIETNRRERGSNVYFNAHSVGHFKFMALSFYARELHHKSVGRCLTYSQFVHLIFLRCSIKSIYYGVVSNFCAIIEWGRNKISLYMCTRVPKIDGFSYARFFSGTRSLAKQQINFDVKLSWETFTTQNKTRLMHRIS